MKEYKAKIRSFNNVDDRLMAIDIDDLGKILTLIRYRWTPVYSEEINGLINGVQRCVDSKQRELLPSDEEKHQIERQQRMERQMLEEADHTCRENKMDGFKWWHVILRVGVYGRV